MGPGDKAAALSLSGQAMAVIPTENLARVAARIGEPDRAIAALQKLLSIPGADALAKTCRSLLRCSGSIQCSIRSGTFNASSN